MNRNIIICLLYGFIHNTVPSTWPCGMIMRSCQAQNLPVVPHKAVAEVSGGGRKPTGEFGCCEPRMAQQNH